MCHNLPAACIAGARASPGRRFARRSSESAGGNRRRSAVRIAVAPRYSSLPRVRAGRPDLIRPWKPAVHWERWRPTVRRCCVTTNAGKMPAVPVTSCPWALSLQVDSRASATRIVVWTTSGVRCGKAVLGACEEPVAAGEGRCCGQLRALHRECSPAAVSAGNSTHAIQLSRCHFRQVAGK